MDSSYPDENARLRAQQITLRKMAEYKLLLLQRVAVYTSEINRLKALVAKLQRMQFSKNSEKLREKTQRQVCEAEERISTLQEEIAEQLELISSAFKVIETQRPKLACWRASSRRRARNTRLITVSRRYTAARAWS